MHRQAELLARVRGLPAPLLALLAVAALAGCATGGDPGAGAKAASDSAAVAGLGAGTVPEALEFLYAFENQAGNPYYPIEGIAGVAYAPDGTLLFCDEKGGRVHAREAASGDWFVLDSAPSRPYRPLDAQVDGFTILVLDAGGRQLHRFDMRGVYQDRLLSFQSLEPGKTRLPTAFDIDVDGRLVVTDAAEQEVLLLDSFLSVTQTLGNPGAHREQFDEPSGVVYLPDGGFLVADRGNRRLQRFNRLGYFEAVVGGEFDIDNPFVTPQGIDVDAFGNVFVADPAAGVVHALARAGRVLFSLGPDEGLLAGPEAPIDVAVGPEDLLAIADRGRQAVLVYRIIYE